MTARPVRETARRKLQLLGVRLVPPGQPAPRAGPLGRDGPWRDVATVALVVVLAVAIGLWEETGRSTTVWWVQLVVALPLLARRRLPAEVLASTAVVAVAQFVVSGVQAGEVALLVALYSVGAHERRGWALVGGEALALVGGTAAVVVWSPDDDTAQTVVLLAGTVSAAWLAGIYVRTRRAYLRSVLDRAATAERERDQQALTIRAEQRDQLSREIHDIVAHNLSVMIALGDGATVALDRDPTAARTAIAQSSAIGRLALDEIRRLLGAMREHITPGTGPQPGLADLDGLVERVRAAHLSVTMVVTGRAPDVPAGAQLAVYRIVQEGLTNVLKHAPAATWARVEIRFEGRDVHLTVSNDGSSRPDSVPEQLGHGIAGMRERAAVLAGHVEAGPVSLDQWRVQARLVLPTPEVPAR